MPIKSINDAIDLAKRLHAMFVRSQDIESQKIVQDLEEGLLAARRRIIELEEENDKLKREGSGRPKELVVLRGHAYWLAVPGVRPPGPYCTACWDAHQKLSIVHAPPPPFNDLLKYQCPVCRAELG